MKYEKPGGFMIKKILKSGLAALIIIMLLSPYAAMAVGDLVYTNSRWLADNLEYVNTVKWSHQYGRTESFMLRMTGPGDAYPIVMGGDSIFGSTRISDMVEFATNQGKNLLAMMNADFFSLQTGVPLGIVIEDGVYISSSSGRGAICFSEDGGAFFITSPRVDICLYNNGGGADADNAGKTTDLYHFNKFRADTGGLVMFSEAFSSVSTRTTTPGWFVVFDILEGTPSVSGSMELEVADLITTSGAIPIGEGQMILSSAAQSGYGVEYEKYAIGDIVTMTTTCNDERLTEARYATGAGDILISDGEITDPESWDRALLSRNPRTAFGVHEDGTVVCYVVDGRDSTHSVGLTLEELADELLREGCVYAVNLDGGGSTAVSLRLPGEDTPTVISRPSGGFERGCATYILFVTDAEPDGEAHILHLVNDGAIVLAGSSIELAFTATDAGYMPCETPGDIFAFPEFPDSIPDEPETPLDGSEPHTGGAGAFIDGRTYTTGSVAGVETISLYSPSTGAHGTGEIFVITRPTSITPVAPDTLANLNSIKLIPGETFEIGVVATYYRRQVTAQVHSFTFEISGDIGEMIAPGVFLAGDVMQQKGTITVSAGGRSAVINVEIGGFLDMQEHWAREYADYLASVGIVTGVTPVSYDPERMMSRGDFCLMLYRTAGLPEFEMVETFDDVPDDIYYAKAVAWARAAGIAEAVEGNDFCPAEPLSRQDTFTWIYRALDILDKQYEDGVPDDLEIFPDSWELADYAVIPTATLISLGLVGGMDGRLEPAGTLTRAQMAKIVATVIQL